MKSHDVRFWETRQNKTAKGASYTVRWTVAGREKVPYPGREGTR